MEFITGKYLSRRTFIRGAGATVALPFLDAMVPAGRLWAREVADPTRLVCIEMVHGSAGSSGFGAAQNYWSPAATGRGFDLSPTALSSLEPYRDYLTIISDTDVEPAEARQPKEIGGDHFRSSATFLTQAHPKQTESSDVFVGTSMDQLYANRFGQDTPIPSMQLCIENVDQAGGCAYGYACVYTDTISWSSPTQPLPMIRDPRVAFDQLFGAGGTPEARAARQRSSASILDFLTGEVASLRGRLDPSDRQRMDRYLENVREIERRIQRVVARNESGEDRDLPEAPAGVPDSFDEHVKLMFDLQALAFQTDMTRVFSFKMGRDASGRVYPESGIDRGFHPASHHGDNENNITDFAQINRYHVGLVPYFLDRLKESMEGDTHLLDKTMIVYGSPMGDPNVHNHKRCPLFVVGGAQGRMEGNLHLRAAPGTPMANVMLSLMHRLGMDDVTSFGNSTGEFSLAEMAD
ncbi:MAG: DUF1552 domain-containing protein [Gemmatimonadales bacterium]|nr:DUF1552 domain-containing protein [Gemmatimonadales bacterium]MYG50170.1 DUF1552 domain-containing protein [Gemmatimonadales bacterium]MYK02592.1 DUF1552 domain-containing protein [Candidatus Palauibacter ramosifaciens]